MQNLHNDEVYYDVINDEAIVIKVGVLISTLSVCHCVKFRFDWLMYCRNTISQFE